MLSAIVLFLVLVVAAGSAAVALIDRGRIQQEVDGFVAGLDVRTKPEEPDTGSPVLRESATVPEDLGLLLDEAIQAEEHGLAVLALSEITGRASLARTRARTLSRGLSRISLLSGAGGAFTVAALGSFERAALLEAGASVVMGLIGSILSRSLSLRSLALSKRYIELTDVLAAQVARQYRDVSRGG